MSDPSYKPKHLAYVPEGELLDLRVWNVGKTQQGTVKATWVGQYQERWVRIEWDNGKRSLQELCDCKQVLTVDSSSK